jgi:hypothetical protein
MVDFMLGVLIEKKIKDDPEQNKLNCQTIF